MQRRYSALGAFIIIVIASIAAWYLMTPAQPGDEGVPADGLEVSSAAFENTGEIPEKYTGEGQDLSPPLEVSGVKGDYIAVIMDDPDACGFVHWLIWNISADTGSIFEGVPRGGTVQAIDGAKQGRNDFGDIGYGGPKPPEGEEHEYRIRVYTLDQELDLESGSTKDDLLAEMEDHIVQMTEYLGKYER